MREPRKPDWLQTPANVKTVRDLRQVLRGLPDDMGVYGFYDGGFGQGLVWVEATPDIDDVDYLAIDVERA